MTTTAMSICSCSDDCKRRVSIEVDKTGKDEMVEFRKPSSSSTTKTTSVQQQLQQQQQQQQQVNSTIRTKTTATATTTTTGDIFEQIQSLSLRGIKRCTPSFQLATSNDRRRNKGTSMKRRRSPSSSTKGCLSSEDSSSLTGGGGGEKLLCFNEDVSIYEFKTILGDNPSVTDGCPVALDYQLSNSKIVHLDELERSNDHRRYNQLKMKSNERAQRLYDAGYSIQDIAKATVETTKKNKDKRGGDKNKQRWDSFGRRLKKLNLIGSSSKRKNSSPKRKFKDDTELNMIDDRNCSSSSNYSSNNNIIISNNETTTPQQLQDVSSRRVVRTHSL